MGAMPGPCAYELHLPDEERRLKVKATLRTVCEYSEIITPLSTSGMTKLVLNAVSAISYLDVVAKDEYVEYSVRVSTADKKCVDFMTSEKTYLGAPSQIVSELSNAILKQDP